MPKRYKLKVKNPKLDITFADFNGPDYNPQYDKVRLTGQILRVFNCMKDGKWRTFKEIKNITGDPEPSISAQLRHLRKFKFGMHTINKRPRGDRSKGLFEYQLIVNMEVLI